LLDQKQKYSLFGNTFEKLIFELDTDMENLNEEKGPIKNDDVYLMIEGSKQKTEMHKKENFSLKKHDQPEEEVCHDEHKRILRNLFPSESTVYVAPQPKIEFKLK